MQNATDGSYALKASLRQKTSKTSFMAAVKNLTNLDVAALPVYLKIARAGTEVRLSQSANGVDYLPVGTVTIGSDGTTTNPKVNLGASAYFGMIATGGGGGAVLARFAEVNPAFEGTTGPQPPTNLQATGGTKQVSLTWTAPASGPAPTSYAVYRGGAKVGEPATTSYTDSAGLADATEYCYTVKSIAGGVESAATASKCATTLPGGGGAQFRRGDADGSGKLDLTDAIFTLQFLFMGGKAPDCKDAADTDDSGKLDLTDAIASLQFQFMGGAAPAAPGPTTCGPDPSAGDEYTVCDYTKC
jgi:hypothetical protein